VTQVTQVTQVMQVTQVTQVTPLNAFALTTLEMVGVLAEGTWGQLPRRLRRCTTTTFFAYRPIPQICGLF
jgi:hypothetical protein